MIHLDFLKETVNKRGIMVARAQSPIVQHLVTTYRLMDDISDPLVRATVCNAGCKENIRAVSVLTTFLSSEEVSGTIDSSIAILNDIYIVYAKSVATQVKMADLHLECLTQLTHLRAGMQGSINAGDSNAEHRITALDKAVKIIYLFNQKLTALNHLLNERSALCKSDLTPLYVHAIPPQDRSYLSRVSWENQYLKLHPGLNFRGVSDHQDPISLDIPDRLATGRIDPALSNREHLDQLKAATEEFDKLSPTIFTSSSGSSAHALAAPPSGTVSVVSAGDADDDELTASVTAASPPAAALPSAASASAMPESPSPAAPAAGPFTSSSGSSSYATAAAVSPTPARPPRAVWPTPAAPAASAAPASSASAAQKGAGKPAAPIAPPPNAAAGGKKKADAAA